MVGDYFSHRVRGPTASSGVRARDRADRRAACTRRSSRARSRRSGSASRARQRFARACVDADVSARVELRRAAVDDREAPPAASVSSGRPGDRIDLERRADDEQQPGLARRGGRALDRRLGKQLAEHDDVRLEDAPARSGTRARGSQRRAPRRRRRAVPHSRQLDVRIEPCTSTTRARAGARVQPVDVLRDRSRRIQPAPLELGERTMAVVRLRLGEHGKPLAVEVPHLRRVREERVDRRVLHRVVLRQMPRRRTEVGDPRLRADAGAGQDDARLVRRASARRGARPTCAHRRVAPWTGSPSRRAVRVRFADTDAQGIAHNAAYLVWFEVARVEYLARVRRRLSDAARPRDRGARARVALPLSRARRVFDDEPRRAHALRRPARRAVPLRVRDRPRRRHADRGRLDRARVRGLARRSGPTRMPEWLADAIRPAESSSSASSLSSVVVVRRLRLLASSSARAARASARRGRTSTTCRGRAACRPRRRRRA